MLWRKADGVLPEWLIDGPLARNLPIAATDVTRYKIASRNTACDKRIVDAVHGAYSVAAPPFAASHFATSASICSTVQSSISRGVKLFLAK